MQSQAGGNANPSDPQALSILQAFAIPMATAQHPGCEALNRDLRELFLAREKEGDRYSNPEPRVRRNKTLFESSFDLFNWPENCVRQLRDFCFGHLFQTIGQLNGYAPEHIKNLRYACESWFHITRGGGYFGAHNHPNHSWSGVYCVRHDGDDPATDSGKLTFINPNLAGNMYIDAATARLKPPYSTAPIMLRLKPGQLILFPSWLLHEVMPYEGTSERITVAFNMKFRYEGTPPF